MSIGIKMSCRLCDIGFLLKDGWHLPSQSLGMIPNTKFENQMIDERKEIHKTKVTEGYDLEHQGMWFVFPNKVLVFLPDELCHHLPKEWPDDATEVSITYSIIMAITAP